MIKILMLLCAFLIMPVHAADVQPVVTPEPSVTFYLTTYPPVMVSQERSYKVTGEDHATTNSDADIKRDDGPVEVGWRM